VVIAAAVQCWPLAAVVAEEAPASDSERAVKLGQEGFERFTHGRWAEALASFELAERLRHSPVFVLYIARSRHRLGALVAARDAYRQLAGERIDEEAPKAWHSAVADGKREYLTLEARIPRLMVIVRGTAAATTITVDGKPLARAASAALDPGVHHVVAKNAQGTRETWVELREGGGVKRVVMQFGIAPPPTAVPAEEGAWAAELSLGMPIAPTLGGVTSGGCDDGCDRSVALGFDGRVVGTYEFPFGLGMGIYLGGETLGQSRRGRAALVAPVGRPDNQGTIDDDVRISGANLGGVLGITFGDRVVGQFRLGTGFLIGSVASRRTADFVSSSSLAYAVGPVTSAGGVVFWVIEPQARAGIHITDALMLSAGIAATILYPFTQPTWDQLDPFAAGDDGLARFEAEPLIGRWIVAAKPTLAAQLRF
jgi:hypothetical protein